MSSDAPSTERAGRLWRRDLIVVGMLAAAAAAQFLLLVATHRTFIAGQDNAGQFFPWYQKLSSALHAGRLPLWDQNAYSGHLLVGEIQPGVFYPVNWLWLGVFGGSAGTSARSLDGLVVAHSLVGAVGMYAFARSLRLSRPAAYVAGVLYAFAGPVPVRAVGQVAIYYGLQLIPWALFFTHRFCKTHKVRYMVGAGGTVGLIVLAGHVQPAFHAALLCALLLITTWPSLTEDHFRKAYLGARVRGGLVFGVATCAVALPQLAYSVSYFTRAYRFQSEPRPTPPGGHVSFQTFALKFSPGPDVVLTFLNPQKFTFDEQASIFLGLSAATLIVWGALSSARNRLPGIGRQESRALAIGAVVGALAVAGPWTPLPRVLYELPLVAQIRELGRYIILVHIALCVLAAVAYQHAPREKSAHAGLSRVPRGGIALGVLLVSDGVYLSREHTAGFTRSFALQVALAGLTLLILVLAPRVPRRVTAATLTSLVTVSALAWTVEIAPKAASAVTPATLFSRTPTVTFVDQHCAGHRTAIVDDALPRNIGDVFPRIRTVGGYSATMDVPYFDFLSTKGYSEQGLRLLDVGCVVAASPFTRTGFDPVFSDGGRTVYQNPDVSAINTLDGSRPIEAVSLVDDERHRAWRITVPSATGVMVSALDYPGWKLRVDGVLTDHGTFPINGRPLFPTAEIPAGTHDVDWSWSGRPSW